MLRTSLSLIFAILFLPSIFACECQLPASDEEALEASTFAFVGKCILLNTNWMSGGMKYSFEVEKSWKKSTDRFMVVNVPFIQDCGGMKIEVGKRYLVFVEKKFSPKTNRCMGTKVAVQEEVDALGEGITPQASKLIQPMIWTVSGLVALLMVVVLVAVLRRKS